MRRPASLAALAMLLGVAPAQAALRALVMGFDTYASKISLEGSQNDAIDIGTVLRRRGVSDITTLSDATVNRATVEQAWFAMLARAAVGDVLFVSFSGHGNRSPEKGEPKHTPDGFEKGFLLPLYDEERFPEEQLRDEHLYDLFKAASDRGFKIVFVADACHAGATVRAVTGAAVVPKFQMFQTHGKPLPPPPPPAAIVRRPPIAGLTIFSAADEKQTIQEFTIEGQRRGALSFVVARGLEGAAAGAGGLITAGDLGHYVVTNVRLRSNNTQIPSAVAPNPETPIFAGGTAPALSVLPALGTVPLFVDGGVPVTFEGAVLAAQQQDAVLSWVGRDRVLNAHGDVIAKGVGSNQMQGVVDARRVLDALTGLVGQGATGLTTTVAAEGKPATDRYYLPGERIRIEAEASPLRFLTVIDLTADGTIQFLWPTRRDPLEWTAAEAPNFKVRVAPPYGQDTLIFIESDRALTDLHTDLARLDNQIAPLAFFDALKLWLPHTTFRLGFQPVFTCARLNGDASCT